MELQGEARIAAPRAKVWDALNDPAVLARCIDGVESLEPDGENRFKGSLDAKVGPVRARFSGTVSLTEIDPPSRYVLVGEGKGGVAGFAKGSAEVRLDDAEDGGTILSYTARSQVGGKLAQLGARLVEGAARGYADSFFSNFRAIVEDSETVTESAAEPPQSAHAPAEPAASPPPGRGVPPLLWSLLLVAAVVLLLLFLLG
jgi:carbon monoxide dehydrogenase subunit G